MNPNILACDTCRTPVWSCWDRLRYFILYFLGYTMCQCWKHEDIEISRRKTETQMRLNFVNKEKVRLEKILMED